MPLRLPNNTTAVIDHHGAVHIRGNLFGDLWCEEEYADLEVTNFDVDSLCDDCKLALIDEGYDDGE